MSDFDDLRMSGINHLLDDLIANASSQAYANRLRAQRDLAYELVRCLELQNQAEMLKDLAKELGVNLQ
jgi:hypothetical protein